MDIKYIAKVIHQANKAYCETLNDTSQVNWHNAPQWQKDSVIQGVQYHLDNPNLTAEESHNNWLKVKENDGWSYGEVKDLENKKHPCMKPYDDLPVAMKRKNLLFKQIVEAFRVHSAT